MSQQDPGQYPSDGGDDRSSSGGQYGYGQQNPYGQPSNPYQQPSPYAGYPQGPYRGPQPGKGMAITSLVFGIIAVVLCLIPFIGFISIIGGLVAVVVGIIALAKKKPGRGMSIAGVIMGALGLIIAIIVTVVSIMFINAGVESVSEPRSVTYTVSTNVPAEVEYFDGEGTSTEQISGDWTEEIDFTGPPLSTVAVTPADPAEGSAELSCRIEVNGETVAEQQASGSGAAAVCVGLAGGL